MSRSGGSAPDAPPGGRFVSPSSTRGYATSSPSIAKPRLSGVRTFVFGGLATVWFSEMLFMGFRPLSTVWSRLWQVPLPADPLVAAAVFGAWAAAAPVKGALGVMAVYGLRSRHPSVRTALYVSMSLVPPLNIAFPFRQQGFLPRPMAIATTLSVILWGSFVLFREHAPRPARQNTAAAVRVPMSRWEVVQLAWFVLYSVALTLTALLLLFRTRTGMTLILPCLAPSLGGSSDVASVIHTGLAAGTHWLALSVGAWIATVNLRRLPTLRRVMTVALTVHAVLVCVFPLRRIALELGTSCAASSIFSPYLLLSVAWVLFAVISWSRTPATPSPNRSLPWTR